MLTLISYLQLLFKGFTDTLHNLGSASNTHCGKQYVLHPNMINPDAKKKKMSMTETDMAGWIIKIICK